MHPKDAEGIANSVDPDQTAPLGGLIWVCTVCPDLSVRKLRNITVGIIFHISHENRGDSNEYEGCSLINVFGFFTRKSALPPQSQH